MFTGEQQQVDATRRQCTVIPRIFTLHLRPKMHKNEMEHARLRMHEPDGANFN